MGSKEFDKSLPAKSVKQGDTKGTLNPKCSRCRSQEFRCIPAKALSLGCSACEQDDVECSRRLVSTMALSPPDSNTTANIPSGRPGKGNIPGAQNLEFDQSNLNQGSEQLEDAPLPESSSFRQSSPQNSSVDLTSTSDEQVGSFTAPRKLSSSPSSSPYGNKRARMKAEGKQKNGSDAAKPFLPTLELDNKLSSDQSRQVVEAGLNKLDPLRWKKPANHGGR